MTVACVELQGTAQTAAARKQARKKKAHALTDCDINCCEEFYEVSLASSLRCSKSPASSLKKKPKTAREGNGKGKMSGNFELEARSRACPPMLHTYVMHTDTYFGTVSGYPTTRYRNRYHTNPGTGLKPGQLNRARHGTGLDIRPKPG